MLRGGCFLLKTGTFWNCISDVKHSGIVYAIKGSRTTGEILRSLILIWEVLTPEDMAGNLEYL